MTALLEVENLVAGYGSARIVTGVSFTIDEGDTVALLGRNGMGKSTLLRAIFGLAERFEGEVRVRGLAVATRRPELLARAGLTLVPDDRGVFPRLTVEENLHLAALSAPKDGPSLDPLGPFPELRERARQPAGALSGGLQQQLAIARALSTRPALIAVDELSQGVQPSIVESLAITLIRVSAEHGIALLVVDQSPDLATRICGRALIMQKGRIAADVSSATANSDHMDLLVV
jgi:ABC-type branched-subunit amino acid transport system ATPase component